MQLTQLITLAVAAGSASAQSVYQGFNYGATNPDGSCRGYNDYVNYFNRAKNLAGASGFASVRLYTSIQCGTASTPIEAFQAAIDTDTSILVGIWASAGRDVIGNEINALKAAASQLGTAFTDRIVGISVGSEDLYRSSPQGVAGNAGVGATGAEIEGYIGWLKDWIAGTALQGKPIGHVDTWTAWILPENAGVAAACDWLGHNSFPYFEDTKPNSIGDAAADFTFAVGQTEGVAAGKPVWITETGWPVCKSILPPFTCYPFAHTCDNNSRTSKRTSRRFHRQCPHLLVAGGMLTIRQAQHMVVHAR
jgi:glucan endo-1,3-beta-D-glucosidase